LSETHRLGLVITDVFLASTVVLNLFKVAQIILLLHLFNLLLILRCPHSIPKSVCLVHDVHLGLKLKVEFIPVFLEEGIVVVATKVFSVQLHVIETVGILARIGKEFVDHGPSHFFS
jgi:hypothetical protein